MDLGSLRLGQGQSFTIDGLTITNVTGFANGGSAVQTTATILTAADIATILQSYFTTGNTSGSVTIGGSTTAASKFVKIEGNIEALKTNGWLDASGNATVAASGGILTITNQNFGNVADLNFTFAGNKSTNGYGAETNKVQTFVDGKAAVAAVTSGDFTFAAANISTATTKAFTFSIGSASLTITLTGTATANTVNSITAGALATGIKSILEAGTGTGVTISGASITTSGGGTAWTKAIGNWTLATATGGKVSFSGFESGDSITYDTTTIGYKDATPAVQGQLTIDFGTGLLAGQSYTFLNKTIVATKDLTGEQIAEAFAFGDATSSGVDGAVVLGAWGLKYSAAGSTGNSAGIDPTNVLFDISGSSLILMEQTPGGAIGLKLDGFPDSMLTLKGTGTLAVRTDSVTGTTTTQGEKNGQLAADSYVTFSVIGGSAPSGAGSAGVVTVVNANTNALDTITNFDISTDKLLLKDVDGTALSFASGGNITVSGGSIYVDTAGNTLSATTTQGILTFTAGNAAADAITLNQKLYVAAENITNGNVVGFEHGGDTYVVLGGQISGASTDDLIIKLTGVTGITDITSILA